MDSDTDMPESETILNSDDSFAEIHKIIGDDVDVSIDSINVTTEQKNICREMRSLLESAKESKIIKEFTQNINEKRVSRKRPINSFTKYDQDYYTTGDCKKKKKSDSSELDTDNGKPNRGNISEQLDFLNNASDNDDQINSKDLVIKDDTGRRIDPFCWRCHRSETKISCSLCPRTFHQRCLTIKSSSDMTACSECITIMNAENMDMRSLVMQRISLEELCKLLQFALNKMMLVKGAEPFMNCVDSAELPDYHNYISEPMFLSKLGDKVANQSYGSTAAFIRDVMWISHNSKIYNGFQNKLTSISKAIVQTCKKEMLQIENCPQCYLNSNTYFNDIELNAANPNHSFFADVCDIPHIILWAKVKGFPYWPAKGMGIFYASNQYFVHLQFFGQHDTSSLPAKDCYLYSEQDPNSVKKKNNGFQGAMAELFLHINNIKQKFGEFIPAPFKTLYDPKLQQLKSMIPSITFDTTLLLKNCNLSYSSFTEPSKIDGDNSVLQSGMMLMTNDKHRSINITDTSNTANMSNFDDETLNEIKDEPVFIQNENENEDIINDNVIDASTIEITQSFPEIDSNNTTTSKNKPNFSNYMEEYIAALDNKGKKDSQQISKNSSKINATEQAEEKIVHMTEECAKKNNIDIVIPQVNSDVNKPVEMENVVTEINKLPIDKSKIDNDENEKGKELSNLNIKPVNTFNNDLIKNSIIQKPSPVKTSRTKRKDNLSLLKISNENEIREVPNLPKIKDVIISVNKLENYVVLSDLVSAPIKKLVKRQKPKVNKNFRRSKPKTIRGKRNLNKKNKIDDDSLHIHPKLKDSEDVSIGNTSQYSDDTSNESLIIKLPISDDNTEKTTEENNDPLKIDSFPKNKTKKPVKNYGMKKKRAKLPENGSLKSSKTISPPNIIENNNSQNNIISLKPLPEKYIKDIKNIADIIESDKNILLDSLHLLRNTVLDSQPNNLVVKNSNGNIKKYKSPAELRSELKSKSIVENTCIQTSSEITDNKSINDDVNIDLFQIEPSFESTRNDMEVCNIMNIENIQSESTSNEMFPVFIKPIEITEGQYPIVYFPNKDVEKPADKSANPEVSEVLGIPEVSEVLAVSEVSGIPKVSEVAGISEVPGVSKVPDNPYAGSLGDFGEKIFRESAEKMTKYFRNVLASTIHSMSQDTTETSLPAIKFKVEHLRWENEQKIKEMKYNFALTMMEMRASMKADKDNALHELWEKFKEEKNEAISATKKKQWCANCQKESHIACCWNTSYCTPACQSSHKLNHMSICKKEEIASNTPKAKILSNVLLTSSPIFEKDLTKTNSTTEVIPSLHNITNPSKYILTAPSIPRIEKRPLFDSVNM